mmetsp:Transcript_148292/g.413025  ORF Transcript_148292/g.413025 Transcript_148292/m.413025 type:complete len:222 (+) Transcript_148292:62-727(+)
MSRLCARSVLMASMLAGAALLHVAPRAFAGAGAPQGRTFAASALRATMQEGSLCGSETEVEPSEISSFRVGSAIVSLLAALLVALMPVAEAQAARTGGRIGSSAPSKREQKAPPPTQRAAAPRVINKTTVVEKTNVVVAPPPPPAVIMAPASVIVAPPPPTVGDIIVGAAVSSALNSAIAPHGPTTTDRIMENQIRQDERQLDRQAVQIEELQRELRDLKK